MGTRSLTLVSSFNGGEISPLVSGRLDVVRVDAGLRRCENWIPLPHGPVVRRPGFLEYIPARDATKPPWLMPFRFSANPNDHFLIEVGDLYFRFHTLEGGVLRKPDGTIYEVPSQHGYVELTTEEGTFRLRTHQEGDIIFIASRYHPPKVLERHGLLDWQYGGFDFAGGPWNDMNTGGVSLTPSGTDGNITITADGDLFTADHVFALVRLHLSSWSTIKPWESGVSVNQDSTRISDGKVYSATGGGTTGGTKPVHDEGERSDGSVNWLYLHSGYGWARITKFTNARKVSATVLGSIPQKVVDDGTERWQIGAWNGVDGYPEAVGIAFGRLVWGRGRWLFFSKPDNFYDYEDMKSGKIVDDDGFSLAIKATVNIRWISTSGQQVIIGTDAGEYLLTKLTETEPFSPTNAQVLPLSTYGVRQTEPVQAQGRLLFPQRAGRRLIELSGQVSPDGSAGQGANEPSIMAEHMLRARVVSMAWQGEPWGVLWVVTADGGLCSMTYHPQQQVYAWARHPLPAGAAAHALVGLPSLDQDQIGAVLLLDGRPYICGLAPFWTQGDARSDARLADFAVAHAGTPQQTAAGLAHLAGRTAGILADGRDLEPVTVPTNGLVPLPFAASEWTAGLLVDAQLEKRDLQLPSGVGTAQTSVKRPTEVRLRVLDSGGLEAGPDTGHLVSMTRRRHEDPLGQPEPLFNGDYVVSPWDGDYEREDVYVVRANSMLPSTIIMLVADVVVQT